MTNFMVQSPSEADSHSSHQEIVHLLGAQRSIVMSTLPWANWV